MELRLWGLKDVREYNESDKYKEFGKYNRFNRCVQVHRELLFKSLGRINSGSFSGLLFSSIEDWVRYEI